MTSRACAWRSPNRCAPGATSLPWPTTAARRWKRCSIRTGLAWRMPGMDGIDVCRHVRAEPEGGYAYLVLMTAQGGREPMLEGLQAGADDFLAKPIDAAELRA